MSKASSLDRPTIAWIAALVLMTSVVSIIVTARRDASAGLPPAEPMPTPPTPIDTGWTLTTLDGETTTYEEASLGRPVLLNVWATWCGPCLVEMPTFAKLAAREDLPDDVVFMLVTCEEDIDPEKVRKTLEDLGVDLPAYISSPYDLPQPLYTEAIPATFLLDHEGKLAASGIGAHNWDSDTVVAMLQDLSEAAASARDRDAGSGEAQAPEGDSEGSPGEGTEEPGPASGSDESGQDGDA